MQLDDAFHLHLVDSKHSQHSASINFLIAMSQAGVQFTLFGSDFRVRSVMEVTKDTHNGIKLQYVIPRKHCIICNVYLG